MKQSKKTLFALLLALVMIVSSVGLTGCEWLEDLFNKTAVVKVENGMGGGEYEIGSEVTVTATVPGGKVFVNWTVDGVEVSKENPYTFKVEKDITLTANLKDSGDVDPNPNPNPDPNPEDPWAGAVLDENLEVTMNWWLMQPLYFVGDKLSVSEYPIENFTDERANDVEDYHTVLKISKEGGEEEIVGADGYTFTSAGNYTVYRYAVKDGKYAKSEGFAITVLQADGTAPEGVELHDGAVIGSDYVLKRGTVNGSMGNILAGTANYPYVAFTKEGGYGAGTWLSVSFTGKNRPTVGMFLDANSTLLGGTTGFIVGDFASYKNAGQQVFLNRLTVFDYANINNTGDIISNPLRPANFSPVNDLACAWNQLNDSKNYEFIVGSWTEAIAGSEKSKLVLMVQLYEVAENGEKTLVYNQNRDITNNGQYDYAAQTGDIVLYASNMKEISFSARIMSEDEANAIRFPNRTVSVTNGTVNGKASEVIRQGQSATVIANEPDDGKRFVKWVDVNGVDVSTSATYTFTVSGDIALTAVYEDIPTYAVSVTGGTFKVTGSNEAQTSATLREGTEITFTATIPENHAFVKWSDADGNQISTEASYTITVSKALSLTAHTASTIKYFTVNVVGGTIGGETSATVQENLSATVVANAPEAGKKFTGWKVGEDIVSTETTYTFNVTGDVTITAVYEDLPRYTITVENGTVDGAASKEFIQGEQVTVVANEPADGYVFAGWTVGDKTVSMNSTYTFTAAEALTLKAVYTEASAGMELNKAVENEDGTYTISKSGLTAANRDNIYGDGANLDWGYVAFKGDYGAGSWVSVTFTGKNRPSFGFGHDATNTFNATTGFIVGGSTSGGYNGTKGRFQIFNMNNIHTSGKLISSANRLQFTGAPLDPAVTTASSTDSIAPALGYLDDNKTYEMVIGTWVEEGTTTKFMVNVVLFEIAEDGTKTCIYQQSRDANDNGRWAYQDTNGDIVLYGAFDLDLTFSARLITDSDEITKYRNARKDNVWEPEV